jgi:hypothetical protein
MPTPNADTPHTYPSQAEIVVNGAGVAVKATPQRGRPRSSLDSHSRTAEDGQYQEGAKMTFTAL